jgi:alpha-beta hydrolase superfamily lysophospholipase
LDDEPKAEESRPLGLFRASDGYPLHYTRWHAAGKRRGAVVALHGIQSHAGWYVQTSAQLANAGYDVWFVDRRGSGRNDRDRGHVVHAERLLNDVTHVLGDVRHELRGGPVVLLAVSWGARLASVVAKRRPELVDALALLYPGIHGRVGPRWHQRVLLKLALACGLTRRRVRVPLDDPAVFTDDPHWQQFVRDDPLALREITTSFLRASVDLAAEGQASEEGIRCPTLVMLAGRDRLVDNAATRRWFERLATRERLLLEYPQAAHTLEFEPNRDEIGADLVAWLERLPPSVLGVR